MHLKLFSKWVNFQYKLNDDLTNICALHLNMPRGPFKALNYISLIFQSIYCEKSIGQIPIAKSCGKCLLVKRSKREETKIVQNLKNIKWFYNNSKLHQTLMATRKSFLIWGIIESSGATHDQHKFLRGQSWVFTIINRILLTQLHKPSRTLEL